MTDRKVILITGTSKGIGRHLAEHYANHGYKVIGCSRSDVKHDFENYEHFCLDVTDEEKVEAMISEIRDRLGRLDVLINNAGIGAVHHIMLTPHKTVEEIMGTNVVGPFLLCREGSKLMKARKTGRIVNLSAAANPLRLEGEAAYAASKAAIESMTRILARELAEWNITVNAVGPTPIPTDLIREMPQEKIDQLIDRQAIRRYGEMRDVSNVVDFFIKPESDFITGQVVYLGGC